MTDPIRVGSSVDITISITIDEIQQLTSTGTSGVLRLRPWAGRTWTRDIPWDATWQDIHQALTALPEISHDGVLCWGGPLGTAGVQIQFTGPHGKRSQPDIVVDQAAIAGGSASITTLQQGGPAELDALPTVTVITPGGTPTTLNNVAALDDQGNYRARITPAVAGQHTITAEGASATHGTVTVRQKFTVA